MGFLGLFGAKAELGVELDRTAVLPGETVRATIRVTGGKKDLEVEEGRAELVYENEYTYRRTGRDADGDIETETVRTTDTVVHDRKRSLEAGTVGAGTPSIHSVEFRVPEGAPPSGTGKITSVAWKVNAVLNVKRANDPDASATVSVLAPREAFDRWAERAPELDSHGELDLALRL